MKTVGTDQIIKIHPEPAYTSLLSRIYNGIFDEKEVVVKRVSVDNHKSELGYLRELDNTNVVKYLYHDKDDDFIFIVLEKCDMTLQQCIDSKKEELNHYALLWQLVKGMVYIHDVRKIIHRDLKPSNILLVRRDGKWTAKISDFGISKELPPGESHVSQSMSGSLGYMAPECLRGQPATKRSDMFSLGLIFAYVVSEGQHPYGSNTKEAGENIIQSNMSPNMDSVKCEFVHDVDTLIRSMISWNPEDRPSIKEVQAHHMFWNSNKKLLFIQQISDYLIKDDQIFQKMQPILDSKQAVVAPNWRDTISDSSKFIGRVIQDMKNRKQKDGVCDLLRNIRNLMHHYDEKVGKFEGFDKEIGGKSRGLYSFFKQLFPKLWDHVYTTMRAHSTEFKDFYEYDALQHLEWEGNPESDTAEPEASQDRQSNTENFQEYHKVSQSDIGGNDESGQDLSDDTNALKSDESVKQNQDISKNANSTGLTTDLGRVSVKGDAAKLTLYSYQKELAEQALKGHNSLIIAPTGSGKTVVLTEIIRQHFIKKPKGRVMFVVAKVALARQQFSFLKKHLNLNVQLMIGKLVTAPVGLKLMDSQVTVLTHQVLINELKRKEGEKYISFDDISLLIFDECHHTTGDHPFRILMALLFEYKGWKPEEITTQVVGVTASPGVGKASNRQQVEANLIRLMASLNISQAPQTVEINVRELEQHAKMLQRSMLQIETETDFRDYVASTMAKMDSEVWEKILKERLVRPPPQNKARQEYSNWVHDVRLHASQHMIEEVDESTKVHLYAKALRMYHSLLQLKDLIPNALDVASNRVEFGGEGEDAKRLKCIHDGIRQRAADVKLPMLRKLEEFILEEFEANSDARCMIFVKLRQTAKHLRDCLCANEKIENLKLNPLYLIGEKSSQDEDFSGINEADVRKQFEDGDSKVLVCTSIGEEGLHFAACSLVIMYDYVTGEVGSIQRSGRARARKSRAIIITSTNSKNSEQEQENEVRAKATKLAIRDVQQKNPGDLLKMIRNEQEIHRKKRINLKRARAQSATSDEPPEKWRILCEHCKSYLTTADKLRHYNHDAVIVRDAEFFNHTEKKFIEQEKGSMWGDVDYHCGGEKCKRASNFGEKIAWGMVKNGWRYPALSIKKITLISASGKKLYPKKRSRLPFTVTKSICDSDDDNDGELYEKSEKRGPAEKNISTVLENESCLEMLKIFQDDNDDY